MKPTSGQNLTSYEVVCATRDIEVGRKSITDATVKASKVREEKNWMVQLSVEEDTEGEHAVIAINEANILTKEN